MNSGNRATPCKRWQEWDREERRIDAWIEGVAEFGGTTAGLPERMKANEARKPEHGWNEPCSCTKTICEGTPLARQTHADGLCGCE